ncbi:MAG: adenine phosphoribosyltransferase [Limnochordales bacterium]|nr:adenine phosphoribosyltransferase [Limnochordales bacterium]
MEVGQLKAKIREVADFPTPGVSFKDITTLLKDAEAFRFTVKTLADRYRADRPDLVVGIESRGFLLGAPIAYELGCGIVVVRKPGKLPAERVRVEYELEYGKDALEVHRDAIQPGQRVLLVDDLLATGGTSWAAAELVKRLGGEIVGFAFLIELAYLRGRQRLTGYRVEALVTYES